MRGDEERALTTTAKSLSAEVLSKVPAVTLGFWAIKILATTLGETGGDTVTMTWLGETTDAGNGWGYLIGTGIFGVLLIVFVALQIRARRFNAWLYWATIVASTTAGTTMADFFDRSLGIGYAGGSAILFALLIGTLVAWQRALGSVAINDIRTRRAEIFYWVTIMFSQTLGTALGDWMADSTGLGYEGAAWVFAGALVVVALCYFRTRISRALLFWAAFILTRPLGATLGDLLDKPHAQGGMALSRYAASAVIAIVIIVAIVVIPQRPERLRSNAPQAA